MLEHLIVRNFKRFREATIELGETVVLVGPNNSGKTSVLQALALWELGLRRWHEKRGRRKVLKKRPGITINRRDLVSLPVPDANLLWRDLHHHESRRVAGKQTTQNIRVEVEVHGVSAGSAWVCGLEFDYANPESIYCRPLGTSNSAAREGMAAIPEQALGVRVAYLPPMSGLAANEVRLDPGAVQVRLGEGRTAEVLRNLCHSLRESSENRTAWPALVSNISALFGVELEPPEYIPERGEIVMSYRDQRSVRLDLSASGRGLQQTLLLLAYLHVNPGAVVLLDEPDAHLEILRQRQIYHTVTTLAREQGCQVIAASHSEVLLNEAAGRDVVVALVGHPHRIDDRGTQVAKALKSIGFDQYYQAEQTGWVLYLEGSTDLDVLRGFAQALDHPASSHLERPFVHYVGNLLHRAKDHFYGLREAKPDLAGVAILDRQDVEEAGVLRVKTWQRREIENYLCFPEVLDRYAGELAQQRSAGALFEVAEREHLRSVMRKCITDQVPPAALRDRSHSWWFDTKASDDFLDLVFAAFFDDLGIPNLLRKTDYHVLARLVPRDLIDPDVAKALDLVLEVASRAQPVNQP